MSTIPQTNKPPGRSHLIAQVPKMFDQSIGGHLNPAKHGDILQAPNGMLWIFVGKDVSLQAIYLLDKDTETVACYNGLEVKDDKQGLVFKCFSGPDEPVTFRFYAKGSTNDRKLAETFTRAIQIGQFVRPLERETERESISLHTLAWRIAKLEAALEKLSTAMTHTQHV